MKPVNWVKIQHQWTHLYDIPFPELGLSIAEEPCITGQKSEELVKKFWDLETIGILPPTAKPIARNPDKNLALKKVTESLMASIMRLQLHGKVIEPI